MARRTLKTLNLTEAAALLHMHKETLRERAKAGEIPGAKVGKQWVFIEEDLFIYLRSLYASKRQAVQVTNLEETEGWHCIEEAKSGGYVSRHQMALECARALGLPTE